jgi:hypothetical protein
VKESDKKEEREGVGKKGRGRKGCKEEMRKLSREEIEGRRRKDKGVRKEEEVITISDQYLCTATSNKYYHTHH